jgi:hypothetical protein
MSGGGNFSNQDFGNFMNMNMGQGFGNMGNMEGGGNGFGFGDFSFSRAEDLFNEVFGD